MLTSVPCGENASVRRYLLRAKTEEIMLDVLSDFDSYMHLRGLSPVTVKDRLEILVRLAAFLAPVPLIAATVERLTAWQMQFVHLAPASIDIYTRHVQAFYRWALAAGRITENPSARLTRPRVPAGRPHPTTTDDLRTLFSCTSGTLRIVFALAAFAGLRRGEICRLQRPDLDLQLGTALIQGKGGKERTVPLVPPLLDELRTFVPRHGHIILYRGAPYSNPDTLSLQCLRHLRSLGIDSTLHSMRHAFATNTYRATRDLLLVSELLGHASVKTTQIYAAPDMNDVQQRLRAVSDMADAFLTPRRPQLRAV